WRARRQAHLAAQNGGGKRAATKTPDYGANVRRDSRPSRAHEGNTEGTNGHPAKRRRIDGPAKDQRQVGDRRAQAARKDDGDSKQVISSLFRFNPESTTKPSTSAAPVEESSVEPSNAPLSAEAENFTSLGLSAVLANHLTDKVNIKKPTAIQKAAVAQLLKSEGDAFVQAETGSGKTLAYLLPVVQHIMALSAGYSEESKIHRDSGLFAVILAPTRELARQIAAVLDALLRCAHWIVSGIVIGGEKKKSEKARLRKGLNVLIATPGRLADHLQHTESLDVGQVRWLVLDEGDRLVELGFEEDIKKIISALDFRMEKAKKEGTALKGLPAQRTTILCSATMKMDVQRLGEISLKDARHIQAETNSAVGDDNASEYKQGQTEFLAPAQLKQSYAVVPAKQRLVTLMALLKSQLARKGSVNKVIVFISCADSVDFHFDVFARPKEPTTDDEDGADLAVKPPTNSLTADTTFASSPHLSSPTNRVQVFRLHGSLEQKLRTSTIKTFHATQQPAILLCTDVASRGLDLPNVELVIEFDPSFSRTEHLHRIGRTARAGREGRAMVFLMPGCEEAYVGLLGRDRREGAIGLRRLDADEILRKAFSKPATGGEGRRGKGEMKGWEEAATEWQLDVERWALEDDKALQRARKAYQSHVRAYATHVAAEREFFDIKQLHLGHLAKAFALRDRPGSINVPGMRGSSTSGVGQKRKAGDGAAAKRVVSSKGPAGRSSARDWDADELTPQEVDAQQAARKMRAMSKMNMSGAGEFNLG
ncbi:MAG: DEAD/DEAH box helicase, partial [Terriglobus roseus]|nr:DEAD/DEAH box helicase [Terriglobus roseus]